MLGWDVLVYRTDAKRPRDRPWEVAFARWSTGLGGLDWIRALVDAGLAQSLGDHGGYPCSYRMPARHLLAAIAHGLPAHDSPVVFGEDYVLPAGWNGDLHVDPLQVAACAPDDSLDIEAWDQS
jgi:hypothetical protein